MRYSLSASTIVVLLLSSLVMIASIGVAQETDRALRLLVFHKARATMQIPSDWTYAPQQPEITYEGQSGHVTLSVIYPDVDTLDDLCNTQEVETTRTMLNGLDVCTFQDTETTPVETVYLTEDPDPAEDIQDIVRFIRISGYGDDFETVINSLAFPTRFDVPDAAYLRSLVDIVRAEAFYGADLDWQSIEQNTIQRAEESSLINALRYLDSQLGDAGDNHSLVLSSAQVNRLQNRPAQEAFDTPESVMLTEKTGVVRLSGVAGRDEILSEYASAVQERIAELNAQGATCYIVDLRGNGGGSYVPMVLGLSALLGDGSLVQFIDHDNQLDSEPTLQGNTIIDPVEDHTIEDDMLDDTLQFDTLPPVAVLHGNRTSSSGEIVVISFLARDHTRTFGQETGGFTTGNRVWPLFDESWFVLAGVSMAVPDGESFAGNPIPPQEPVQESSSSAEDVTQNTALDWLEEKTVCQSSDS
jgi:hypothetical protein